MINQIEEKRNKLNLEIREVLSIMDMIDDKNELYEDYKENTLNEELFLDQQIKLILRLKERLINVFKD